MKSGRRVIWMFVIVVVVVPISVFGVTRWYETNFQRLPVLGPENHLIGRFECKDQFGRNINDRYWKSKIVVANFFFTSCPSICPKMMYQLKRVQAYSDKNILISSFTVDPERDSIAKLNAYATRFGIHNNWLLLTGDKTGLYRFARKDLFIDATDGDGGPADFIHSDNLVLIDPRQRIRGYYKGTDESDVNRLMHDIDKLKTEYKL
jgi:protein SCO1/2